MKNDTCANCGNPRDNHPYRHPFVSRVQSAVHAPHTCTPPWPVVPCEACRDEPPALKTWDDVVARGRNCMFVYRTMQAKEAYGWTNEQALAELAYALSADRERLIAQLNSVLGLRVR